MNVEGIDCPYDSNITYCVGENFRGRKLLRIGEKYNFCGENFRGLLAFAAPKDTTPQNFAEKTFANSHKIYSSSKVSLLPSILRFSSHTVDVRLTISVWKLWCLSSSHHSYQVGSAKHLRMHHTTHHLKICVRRGLKEGVSSSKLT